MKRTALLLGWLLTMASQAAAADFETASAAVKNMGVGWNLGNTLDAHNGQAAPDIVKSETMWGQPVTKAELMKMMKEAGFGAIRVPVTWYPHMDAAGKVDAAWMQRVHQVVDYVIDQGLYCILNVHHDTGADSDTHKSWLKADATVYNNQKARYEYLWQQIANEFRDYGERLLFESYNEMLDTYNSWCFASFATSSGYNATVAKSAYDAINSYAQSFVNTVRATGGNNAQRNLVVNTYGACSGAGTWNTHLQDPLKQMSLPTDAVQGHLLFQIHTYPNISNMTSAKNEMTQMFSALKTHLVAKGAPVIIGEWGTSDTQQDYQTMRTKLLEFARYLVQQAKANGMGTFFWMGLSNGVSRSLPAFNQADLAETIVKAYHGDDFQGIFPTEDDFDMVYTVHYTGTWQELNLYDGTLQVSDYKGIKVELGQAPPAGTLQVKLYGSSKEGFQSLNSATTTITFNNSHGSSFSRITLQYCKSGNYSTVVKRIVLQKKDGTEVEVKPSVYWGCTLDVAAQPNKTGITSTVASTPTVSPVLHTLSGQRLSTPPTRGIYIRNGRKVVVK